MVQSRTPMLVGFHPPDSIEVILSRSGFLEDTFNVDLLMQQLRKGVADLVNYQGIGIYLRIKCMCPANINMSTPNLRGPSLSDKTRTGDGHSRDTSRSLYKCAGAHSYTVRECG
ncbi:hypothetical protein OIDMADRAFT_30087 [Oidiodendron maius Zn]|uniref:Uncharacterized protein n=1 Tax=Oidiodendron maius (strain Zn) TaxID=913774 RepID=A0A0C3GUE9_OIDMZ|nr:hypothetical protein OIDMADRAFT_30087 [Oidiodendron maius Zn]